jgi:energy-coupling factor transporter transmembrane protein EcfT
LRIVESAQKLDSRSKLFLWLSIITTAFLLPGSTLLLYLCILVVVVSVAGCLKATVHFALRIVLPTAVMLTFIYGLLMPPSHSAHYVHLANVSINTNGVISGLRISARLMIVGMATITFVKLTPQMQLVAGLRALGLGPSLIAVFISSFNLYSLIVRKMRQIMDAQRARGLTGGTPIVGQLRMYIPILRPLVFGMVLSAAERSALWRSRNYIESASGDSQKLRYADYVVISVACVVIFGGAYIRWLAS